MSADLRRTAARVFPDSRIHPLVGKRPVCEWKTCQHERCWRSDTAAYGVALDGLILLDFDRTPAPHIRELLDAVAYDTLTVRTPRGFHLFLRGALEPSSFSLRGVYDVRSGSGFYAVGVGSEVAGRPYEFLNDCAPLALEGPHTAALVTALHRDAAEARPKRNGSTPAKVRTLVDGERSNGLASLAGTALRRGFSDDAVVAAVRQHNADACEPPLDDAEAVRVARSILRYRQ